MTLSYSGAWTVGQADIMTVLVGCNKRHPLELLPRALSCLSSPGNRQSRWRDIHKKTKSRKKKRTGTVLDYKALETNNQVQCMNLD